MEACSAAGSWWKVRGVSPGCSGGTSSLSSWRRMLWYSLRLAGTKYKETEEDHIKWCSIHNYSSREWSVTVIVDRENISCGWHKVDSQYSPLHIHSILRWQAALGRLKSHAAQVASSTIAGGWRQSYKLIQVLQKRCGSALRVRNFSFKYRSKDAVRSEKM